MRISASFPADADVAAAPPSPQQRHSAGAATSAAGGVVPSSKSVDSPYTTSPDASEGCGETENLSTPRSSDDEEPGMERMESYYDTDDANIEEEDDDDQQRPSSFSYEQMEQKASTTTSPTESATSRRSISTISHRQSFSALVAKQRAEIDQANRERLSYWVEDMAVKRGDLDSRAKACALLCCAAEFELNRYKNQEKIALMSPDTPLRSATLSSIQAHIRDTRVSYSALIAEAKTVIGSRIPNAVFGREELLSLNDADFDMAIHTLHRQQQLRQGVPEGEVQPFSASSPAIGTTSTPSVLLCEFDRDIIRKELASLASQSVGMHAAVAPYTVGILVPTLASQGFTVSSESDDPSTPFCYDLPSTQRTFFRNRKWIGSGETQKHIILSFAAVTSLAQARQLKQVKRKSEIVAAANAELAQWKETSNYAAL